MALARIAPVSSSHRRLSLFIGIIGCYLQILKQLFPTDDRTKATALPKNSCHLWIMLDTNCPLGNNTAMNPEDLTRAVAAAESAVEQMPEGALKTAAFQTILQELLQRQRGKNGVDAVIPTPAPAKRKKNSLSSTGTTGRIEGLIGEGIFGQQRSLAEIRQILAERGWHYEPDDLGTPLTRLVQRKRLRRVRVAEAGKKTWRYSNY
jgi:hypothetical protein